jgi:hypothetical protein
VFLNNLLHFWQLRHDFTGQEARFWISQLLYYIGVSRSGYGGDEIYRGSNSFMGFLVSQARNPLFDALQLTHDGLWLSAFRHGKLSRDLLVTVHRQHVRSERCGLGSSGELAILRRSPVETGSLQWNTKVCINVVFCKGLSFCLRFPIILYTRDLYLASDLCFFPIVYKAGSLQLLEESRLDADIFLIIPQQGRNQEIPCLFFCRDSSLDGSYMTTCTLFSWESSDPLRAASRSRWTTLRTLCNFDSRRP